MMSRITDHIYLGDAEDAQRAPERFGILCVATRQKGEPKRAANINCFRIRKNKTVPVEERLEKALAVMKESEDSGRDLLVHCHAGMERSPYVVMRYLMATRGILYDEAYRIVKGKHRQTLELLEWPDYREKKAI